MPQALQFKNCSPRVFALQSSQIGEFWQFIAPFLARVDRFRDWTDEGVRADLESARAQCWFLADEREIRGILITRIEETSAGKRGLLWIASGDCLEDGLRMYRDHVEPWFVSLGCKTSQVIGRKGWERVLPGYENAGIVLVKELT